MKFAREGEIRCRWSRVNNVDINYKLEGDGPETIVLINGLADDLETWMEQMPDFLGAGYRVLRFDNRGIGKSGRPKGPYTTALMAQDVKGLVDHLKIRDFHLVGVSMGGMIARNTPSPMAAICVPSPSAAPMRRPARSAPACSSSGRTWRR